MEDPGGSDVHADEFCPATGLRSALDDVQQMMHRIKQRYFLEDKRGEDPQDEINIHRQEQREHLDIQKQPDTPVADNCFRENTTVRFSDYLDPQISHNKNVSRTIVEGYMKERLPQVLTWRSNPEQHHRMGNYGKIHKYIDATTRLDRSQTVINNTNIASDLINCDSTPTQKNQIPKQEGKCAANLYQRDSSYLRCNDQAFYSTKSAGGSSKGVRTFKQFGKLSTESKTKRNRTCCGLDGHSNTELSIVVDMKALYKSESTTGEE